MPERPTILVTNDDGIYSPGLKALAGALEEIGEVRAETASFDTYPGKIWWWLVY